MNRFDHLMALKNLYWPRVRFYKAQMEMIESVVYNKRTVVVAGNKLGKDFGAGFIALTFFLAPWLYFEVEKFQEVEGRRDKTKPEWMTHTRRIVTTSVDGDQLRNLWGEIGRFIATSEIPLADTQGGPLTVNMRDISFKEERNMKEPLNYLIGRVTATGEGISGAHAEYTMMIIDEASGADNQIYDFALGWAKKFLEIGNPNQCSNFYYEAVKRGDIKVA